MAGLGGVKQVNLLPYHATHEHKLRTPHGDNGQDGPGRDTHNSPEVNAPTDEYLAELAELFRAEGLYTLVGG